MALALLPLHLDRAFEFPMIRSSLRYVYKQRLVIAKYSENIVLL